QPELNSSLHLTLKLTDSFTTYLDDQNLRHIYRLDPDTKMEDLIIRVATDMQNSPRQWQFRQPSSSLRQHLHSHETLHLQLLGISNRGIGRRKDGLIVLTRQSVGQDLTLSGLLLPQNSQLFAKPRLTIRKSRLIVNLGKSLLFLTFLHSHLSLVVAHRGLTCLAVAGQNLTTRRHSCLPTMMHSLFSASNEIGADTSDWDSDIENENLPSSSTPVMQPTVSCVRHHHTQTDHSWQNCNAPSSSAQNANAAAPQQLWPDWTPPSGRYRTLYDDFPDFTRAVFQTATSNSTPPDLDISGQSVGELAMAFVNTIKAAVASSDFSHILSPQRNFTITKPDGSLLSTGTGVEKEVLYTAFSWYVDHRGAYFLPRFDNTCSIVTTMSFTSHAYVSTDRREDLMILGCLAALLLLHGIAPEPLGPAIIQFAANRCELGSLTWDFVGEYHPELRALLDTWKTMGPSGDITPFQSYFATYRDLEVISLESRDLAQHNALGPEILYTSLIGPQPPEHTELKAFFTGLQLPCPNGFDFLQVIRSSPGGSTSFIAWTWTSIIHDFDSLKSHLLVSPLASSSVAQLAQPGNPVLDMNLTQLLHRFLQGSGAPCPQLFAEAVPRLSRLIPFDQVDSPGFRSKALCWATTGSPHVNFDEQYRITVHFVGPNDTGYDSSAYRASYMKHGLISFRTCFKVGRIPVVHLADLCSRTYPARDEEGNDTEPFTLQQAIDSWLLIEILAGIGGHSML
ncbi:hypothetical protein B0H14DRAFT_2342184, partial [Mycena olivaceomarginata]